MKWADLSLNLNWFIGKYCGPDVVADMSFLSDMCFALGVEPDMQLTPIADDPTPSTLAEIATLNEEDNPHVG